MVDAITEQEYTLQLFRQLDRILFCPDFEGMVCYEVRRKFMGFDLNACNREGMAMTLFAFPGCGMLQLAMESAGEIEHCLYGGDRLEDEAAAEKAGVQFLWAMNWIDGNY